MIDKETLKPCPFCGNEAFIESYLARKGYEATIHCTECLAMINTITYDTESEAVGANIYANKHCIRKDFKQWLEKETEE